MAELVDLYQQYNTVTDERALAGAIDGAMIKMTDGSGEAIVHADNYAAMMRRIGRPYGGYHFAEPGDPIAQADVFAGTLRRIGGWTLAPALDMENGGIPIADRDDWSRAFMQRLRDDLQCRVMVYSSTSWLQSYLQPDSWPYDWDLTWAAQYGVNDGYRHPPNLYPGRIDMHQYTSDGRVPGIAGSVDRDWCPDINALLAYPVGPVTSSEEAVSHIYLPPTPAPKDPKSDPSTWPTAEVTFPIAQIGGWHGACWLQAVFAPYFDADRDPTYNAYVRWANYFCTDDRVNREPWAVGVDDVLNRQGEPFRRMWPAKWGPAPANTVSFSIVYAAPRGGYIEVERER